MYMARVRKQGELTYCLRQTVWNRGCLTFTQVAELGENPSRFIRYAGKNGYYFEETLLDQLDREGVKWDQDILEDVFWPWIDSEVRQSVAVFRNRSISSSTPGRLTSDQKEKIRRTVHPFDKRRAHFLKFGQMKQGHPDRMPPVLFRHLMFKCRDEIEQGFMQEEAALKTRELKTYVYTIFNLQQFFASFMASKMPHVLDQDNVDRFFIDELCLLDKTLFHNLDNTLSGYLQRYVIMFFDYAYDSSTLLNDFVRRFMSERRRYSSQQGSRTVSREKAMEVIGLTAAEWKTIDHVSLKRIYRQKAASLHPDKKSGNHDRFIELKDAYRVLKDYL